MFMAPSKLEFPEADPGGRVVGVTTPPLMKVSNVFELVWQPMYVCLSLFHTKNNIINSFMPN